MTEDAMAALLYWIGCALIVAGWAWTGGAERLVIGLGASLVGFIVLKIVWSKA